MHFGLVILSWCHAWKVVVTPFCFFFFFSKSVFRHVSSMASTLQTRGLRMHLLLFPVPAVKMGASEGGVFDRNATICIQEKNENYI